MRTRIRRRFVVEPLESRIALSNFVVAPTGSDTAAGTATAPWQSLQHAADVVRPGDTVSVRAGNYVGFDLTTSGTPSAPITFQADPGVVINQQNPVTRDGINLEGARDVTIEGFKVVGMPRAGIRSVTNDHVIIRNNTTDQNYEWGIFTAFSDDVDIENNVASRSVTQHGIYVSNSTVSPIVRNNTSWGNYEAGIHMNGDISMGGTGVITGALVEGNTLYDNGHGGASAINADGLQNSRIQNNLIYNTHANGISLYQIDAAAPSTGNVVVNNTVLVASDGRWALNIQNASTGNTVYNNILYNYGTYRGSIEISSDSLPGFTSDYNVVMSRFSSDGGNSRIGLSTWRSTTGQDMHSLIATPTQLFVSPSTNNYYLIASSPAIDRGTSLLAPTYDKDGKPRPSGNGFDIGCYEA